MTTIDERLMWSYTVLEGSMNVLPRFHELHPVVSTFVKTFHPKTQMWTSCQHQRKVRGPHIIWPLSMSESNMMDFHLWRYKSSERAVVLKLLLRVYLLPVLFCLPVRCFLLFHWYYRYIQTPWQMNPPLPPHHLLPKPNRIFPVGENMSDMDSVLLCATQLHERETPDNFQRIRSVWTLISRVKTTTDWVWKMFSFSVRKKKVLVLNKWISTAHRDTWCSR